MKLSLGILAYTLDSELESLTKEAIESYQNVDELIVVENGGQGDYEADTFVRLKRNCDFTAGMNTILRVAKCDYIALVSNDTSLVSGNLRDLCVPDTVTSPLEQQRDLPELNGAFFVIPRTVLEKTGPLDENKFTTYGSDEEYKQRLKDMGIPFRRIDSVVISHLQMQTVSKTNK